MKKKKEKKIIKTDCGHNARSSRSLLGDRASKNEESQLEQEQQQQQQQQ